MRRTPETVVSTPRVLGVDDWAKRRGHSYGTILVDLERHCPVDLLPDRSAETFATWLGQHPGVEIISRDRSTEFARGAREGAPEAVQVADRFHLLVNLREALERFIDRHRKDLRGITLPTGSPEQVLPTSAQRKPARRSLSEEAARHQRHEGRKERHRRVQALHAQGSSIRAISQMLCLSRGTVYRYLRLDEAAVMNRAHQVPSMLDPYLPYLFQRWSDGCHNGVALWRELVARGYPGSRKMVAVWVGHQRQTVEPSTACKNPRRSDGHNDIVPAASSERTAASRQIAWFLLRKPQTLSVAEQATLVHLQQRCPAIASAHVLVHQFSEMVRTRAAAALDPWLEAVATSGLLDLQSFASGLVRDKAAVVEALKQTWSNGQGEGQVGRLKLLKRQMYGRANFDLLRRRVLYTG